MDFGVRSHDEAAQRAIEAIPDIVSTIMPAQFFERPAIESPERRLWLEVLRAAVAWAFRRGSSTHIQRRRDEARAWFAAAGHEVGSFQFVCDMLEFDADRLRAQVALQVERGAGVEGLLGARRGGARGGNIIAPARRRRRSRRRLADAPV
jgi:hypothetical protein